MLNQSHGISRITLIVIIAIAAVALVVGVAVAVLMWPNQNQTSDKSGQQLTDTTPATYQSNQDLDAALKDLDSLDINEAIDAPLKEIDQKAEQF